jgi:hypothetical protein
MSIQAGPTLASAKTMDFNAKAVFDGTSPPTAKAGIESNTTTSISG